MVYKYLFNASSDYGFITFMSATGALFSDLYILLPSPLALYNFLMHGISIYSDVNIPIYLLMENVDKDNPALPYQDKADGGGSPKKGSVSVEIHNKVIDSIFVDELYKEHANFEIAMGKIAKALKDRLDLFPKNNITMADKGVKEILLKVLIDQSGFNDQATMNRIKLIQSHSSSLPLETKESLLLIEKKIEKLHMDFSNDTTDKITNMTDEKQVKVFFDTLNAYRNAVRKELIKYETITQDGFKKNFPDLFKLKEYKKLVNIDRPKCIKQVVDQDSYLKKKISEIINENKKS